MLKAAKKIFKQPEIKCIADDNQSNATPTFGNKM